MNILFHFFEENNFCFEYIEHDQRLDMKQNECTIRLSFVTQSNVDKCTNCRNSLRFVSSIVVLIVYFYFVIVVIVVIV